MKQTPAKPKKTTPKEKEQVFKKPVPPTSQKKRDTKKEKSREVAGEHVSSEQSKRPKLFKSNFTSSSPTVDLHKKTDLEALDREFVEVYGLPANRPGQPTSSNMPSNMPSNQNYSDQPPFLTPRDANPIDSDESGDEVMEEEAGTDEEEDDDEEEEEEEEDVDSCGEIDEEVAAVVERLTQKMRDQQLESISLAPRMPAELAVGEGRCFSWNPQFVSNTQNVTTTPLTVKSKQKKMVPAHYIYQLFSNEAIGYGLIDRRATFVTAMRDNKPGEINETQAFLNDTRYTLLFEEFLKNYRKTPEGQFITMYDGRFVLVKTLVPLSFTVPRLFNRGMERDPARDPPIMDEIVERVCLMPEESTIIHPKAYRWPVQYTYTMVEYAEDPFWTERTIPIPAGLLVPPDPIDGKYERGDPVPPVDWNFVPPPGEPPIHIPPEAWELWFEGKAEHERQVKEEQEKKEKEEKEKQAKAKQEKEKNKSKSSKSKKARKH